MKYSIRVVSTDDDFRALKGAWESLVSEAADANTFLSHAWLHSWWSAYKPRARLRIVLAERDGRLLGIAPMMLSREPGLGGAFRRMRFVGDGTSETDHMNFIVHSRDRADTLAVLLEAIDRLPWDIANFSQMPESSLNTKEVLQYAAKQNWLLGMQSVACPRRTLPRNFEDLLRALPSRLRTAIRSARRELETAHRLEFGMCTAHEELPEALAALYRNHAGRWQAKGAQGVFVSQAKRAFYAELSSRLLDVGALRFYYLRVDGKVVAQQYCFAYGDTVLLLQEGFDMEFSKLNVGNVLRAMVFEHLIANGVATYDFLAGSSRHKQSWSDSAPNDLNIRACRPSIRGRVAHYLPGWIERAKHWVAARDARPD